MNNEKNENESQRKDAARWVTKHPRYIVCPENWSVMKKYLQRAGLKGTPEDLSQAYQGLSALGLLKLKEEDGPRKQ